MSSNPCHYIDYGDKTIKRQTRAAYGCLDAGKSLWAQVKAAAYRLYMRCGMQLVALSYIQYKQKS